LSVTGENPGHPDAEICGAVIRSRLRRGVGPLYSGSCRRVPGLETWCGVMPLGSSGATDPAGRIRGQVGLFLLLLLLQWSEPRKTRRATISFNIINVLGHLARQICSGELPRPVSHGGEGVRQLDTPSSSL
jgi:hypothetical protein